MMRMRREDLRRLPRSLGSSLAWVLVAVVGVMLGYRLFRVLALGTGSTVKIKAHVPRDDDLYCVYPITNTSPGAPLKSGDKICIYCRDPGTKPKCDPIAKVELAGGVWYGLGGADNPICTGCPTKNLYELTA